MSKGQTPESALGLSVAAESQGRVRVLAVGDVETWRRLGHGVPTQDVAFIEFFEVTNATLEQFQPLLIVSPALGRGFDCIDLATQLHGLGYSGEYRALASDFPNPNLIEREVRQLCPQLNFQIIESL